MSTLPINLVPVPVQSPIAQPKNGRKYPRPQDKDPQEGLCTQPWVEWFNSQTLIQSAAATRVDSVFLSAQGASIGATDIATTPLGPGLYRMTYYARITQAATTSSSLEVLFDWTDVGVSVAFTGTAITGNTVASFGSESVTFDCDGSPIRYATTYGSVGGTPMEYKLSVILERLLA